ncbi:MAG: UDP-N-acetylglucosamine 2-epimerase [Chitinophagales bacterium]|nr:UDP-N-acetylglucosamine 2-epimerase [Chitinophagaceae bacterium]MCB9064966.1 UDP-N-acetylglucosamine 2-epimerase [Chitinophagales bacterium]
MLIDLVAGNKLDFFKIAPLIDALHKEQSNGYNIGYRLVFAGKQEEYLEVLNDLSFLSIPQPNTFLETSYNSAAEYLATVIVRYEKVLTLSKPDIVMLFGHSTACMGCAIAAAKDQDVRIAHVEAGLRKRNKYSDNDVNRAITDSVTDYYFSIAKSSNDNLRNMGVADDDIYFVGNLIGDFLLGELGNLPQPPIWSLLKLQQQKYILINLEHPSIIGSQTRLKTLLLNILKQVNNLPIILPVNEESSKAINSLGIKAHNLHITKKLTVSELYYLASNAKAVITDSEHLQDETSIMQTPCITLLKSIARPETALTGYNEVTGLQNDNINAILKQLLNDKWKKATIPYMWDGYASERIVAVLKKLA